MAMLYKLTDHYGKTKGDTQWGEGVTHYAIGTNNNLCTNGVIHAYTDPLLAVMFNPVHGNFDNNMQLWVAEGEIIVDDGMKVGCKSLMTLKTIDIPLISTEQRVYFAILCGKLVYQDAIWNGWADNWINGSNRTAVAAQAAWAAAVAAQAAWAAEAAQAAQTAAWAAARAAQAAQTAARAAAAQAAWAAWAVAETAKIDFLSLIKQAITSN